jgi:hypothetical protein
MSAFFGNMLIALRTSISATTLSALNNATTSSITASGAGGRGTYTYLWSQSGTSCTITSSTSAATTFTGSGVAGTTTVFCNIRDTVTGNALNTPICTITWSAPTIPITAMTFSVPSSFIFNGTTTRTISVSSVTPVGATYSPVSQTFGPAVGTYSMTTSGTGNYTGTYTSGTFRIVDPISVSITASIAAGGVSPQTISVLSISGGSGTYVSGTWSRVAFTGGSGGNVAAIGNGTGSATASRGGNQNLNSTFRVVITDSLGFTGTSNNCVINWIAGN